MDTAQFDDLTRLLLATPSRRRVLRGLAGALGLWVARVPVVARSKQAKKKLKRNQFGCVNVGKPCRGRDGVCCSGRCQGKKPKRGENDRSRCVAHHVGGCAPQEDACVSVIGTACNPDLEFARCYRTSGNASFCGNAAVGGCIACRKDAECEAFGFEQGSACVVCPTCDGYGDTTACISPGATA